MMQLKRTQFMGEKLSTNVSNQSGSTKCITRLTKCILYNIYYERKLLPEHLFVTRTIEGIPLKEFIPTTTHPRICKLNNWLETVTLMIKKKILKNVFFELRTLNEDEILESYSIKYSYRDEQTSKAIPEQCTANNIQLLLKAMKKLFKTNFRENFDIFNLKFCLTADSGIYDIFYYFPGQKNRVIRIIMDDSPEVSDIAMVSTPYHRIIFRQKVDPSNIKEEIKDDDDVVLIDDKSLKKQIELIEIPDTLETRFSSNQSGNTEEPSTIIQELSNITIICICGTQIKNEIFTMIQCHNCLVFQHAECYGYHKIADVPCSHCCLNCSYIVLDRPLKGEITQDRKKSNHDTRLGQYTKCELNEIGIIRLILIYIHRKKMVPMQFLKNNFSTILYKKFMEKLFDFRILVSKNGTFVLNMVKFNLFARKHFRSTATIDNYF